MQNPEIAGATVEKQAPSVLEPEGAVGNPGAPAEEATPAVAAQPSVAVAAQPLARKPSTDAAQSPVSGVATGSDGEGGASPVIPVVRPTTPVPAGSGPDAPSEPQQNNSNSSETSSIPSTSPGSTGAAADDLPVSSEESVVQQQQQHSQHSVKKEIQLKDLFPGDAHSPSGITVFEEARTENPRLFEHLVDQATGRSALHFATLRKDITLVKWLVEEAHAHVNAIDHENQSVAHYAAFYGCLDILEFLKECHASMDVVDKIGRTLVTHAAMRGQCRVLMRLVEDWKMDINSLDYFGASALHWAAARGCVLSSKYLVQMGINVHIAVKGKLAHEFAYGNVKRKEEGLRIYKFLDTYISRGNEFLKMLQYPDVTVGGVESKIASWNKCFKDEWKQPIDIKYYRDQIGRTGLHHAAGKSPLPVLQHLVESCGFSITAEDYLKRLPLHNAGLYGREKNAMWLMKLPAVGAEQVLRLDKARAARNAGDGDRADSGHDESNVQIVRHWKKKSKSGKTAAEIATDGYSMGKHNKEMLGKSLADLAKSYGENVSNQPAAASSVNMKTAAEVERQKDVRSLLSKCKMDEHFDKLCEQGFESFDQLALMTAEDLQMMGVKPGHSRVIMSKVKEVIEGGPDFIADFRLGIEPLDGRRSRQNSIRGDSPVAAADPSLTSAVSPAQARGKMLKRSNTSPILPSRRTSAPPEMNHLHHAQSASTVDGEHRKPHVQSMVVSKSRALDLGDEKGSEPALDPTHLQNSSAMDLLAPPTASALDILAPPPEAEGDARETLEIHDFVPGNDLPSPISQRSTVDLLSPPPEEDGADEANANEPNPEDAVPAVHITSALDLLAPPEESSE